STTALYPPSLHDALPISGAPNSPLTVLLPNGATPPTWAHLLANAAGLADVGRRGLTAVAWVLLVVVVAAFAVVVLEAWSNRIRRSEEHTSELQSRFDLVC